MPKDIRMFDKDEQKHIYNSLNGVRSWLEQIELNTTDEVMIKVNPQYLEDSIELTKKIRDMFS